MLYHVTIYLIFKGGFRGTETPTPFSKQALRLLVVEQPDWMLSSWTELFIACTKQA